jgi:adhesin transport system outer membrane protein
VTLKLEQPVWTAGRTGALIDAAKAQSSAAEFKILESVELIQADVIVAYMELWRAQEKVVAADENVRQLKELASVMTRRVDQQVSPQADLALVNARLSQATAERSVYFGAVRQSASRLQQATGIAVTHAKTLVCSLPSTLSLPPLQDLALAQSSTLKRLESEKTASQFDFSASQAERWPKLVAGVQNIRQQGDVAREDTQAYLGFQYQLTDGLSIVARMSAAESAIQNVQFQYDEVKRRLLQTIDDFHTAYTLSVNQIPALKNLVEVNAELIDSYRRQYSVGKKSWLDVVNAQREVAQSRMLLIDAQANACSNALQIELSTRQDFIKKSSTPTPN